MLNIATANTKRRELY